MWGQTEGSSGKLNQLWRRRQGLIVSLLVLLIVGLALSLFLVFRNHKEDPFKGLPHAYSFLETVSTDNVQLYMMSLSPEDIKPGLPRVSLYGKLMHMGLTVVFSIKMRFYPWLS